MELTSGNLTVRFQPDMRATYFNIGVDSKPVTLILYAKPCKWIDKTMFDILYDCEIDYESNISLYYDPHIDQHLGQSCDQFRCKFIKKKNFITMVPGFSSTSIVRVIRTCMMETTSNVATLFDSEEPEYMEERLAVFNRYLRSRLISAYEKVYTPRNDYKFVNVDNTGATRKSNGWRVFGREVKVDGDMTSADLLDQFLEAFLG